MVRFCRWLLLTGMLLAAGPQLFAASATETRAFNGALMDFGLGYFDRAESKFSAFTSTFTNSARLSEAILYQARSRLEQTNYAGAILLLTAHQGSAGTNADHYLFWLGEANFRKGAYTAAAKAFGDLVRNHPLSPRRVEAGINEATAFARQSEWPQVISLLTQTNGFFRSAAQAMGTNALISRGYLLLSEAELAQKNYPAAESAIQSLGEVSLNPETAWQRQYLLCRLQLATGRTNEALEGTAKLLTLATNNVPPDLIPVSAAFRADLLEKMGRTADAIAAYRMNLTGGISPNYQRTALWKVIQLYLSRDDSAEAAQVLKQFLEQFPTSPSTDMALLTLGEVRLRQYLAAQSTNAVPVKSTNTAAEINYLQSALDSLQEFVKRFPNSTLRGDAELTRGWCFWYQTNLPDAQAAFQEAARQIPASSTNKAVAYFKLADSQFRQNDFSGAITNYRAVVENFKALPDVGASLVEPALYQIVRAGLATNDLASATNALTRLLASYPEGFHADRAILLTGQQMGREGNPVAARKMLEDFVAAAPNAPLIPEAYLAIARTYEQAGDWTNALREYNRCLQGLTNAVMRPEVEYYRAQAVYNSGDATNALALFIKFGEQYPTNGLAPRAQMWVADYYFRSGSFMQAEANYKMLFRNTNNWPVSDLTYQAQMMAGRAAMERGAWDTAKGYLTNLYNTNISTSMGCPLDLRVQALCAYGDCYVSQDSTNKAADYETAIKIFTAVCENYPTHRLAAAAWGEKAGALYQWAKMSALPADFYTNVSSSFQQVIIATNASAAARSQAKVGLAITLAKLAEQASPTNQYALLTLSLSNCLDVFDGAILRDGETLDNSTLFWKKEAGLEAGRIAELLQQWPQAIRIYEALAELVPSGRPRFERNILRCKTKLSQTR